MLAIVADSLTLSRLVAAVILAWLGSQGPGTLRVAILIGMLAWMTDMLDGWAARHAGQPTHLAPYDFAIDTGLYLGMLAYLTLARFLPLAPVLVFVTLAVIAALTLRRKAVQILSVRMIDVASAVVIFTHEIAIGCVVLLCLLASAIIYRRRLAQRVPKWFAELARLVGFRRRV